MQILSTYRPCPWPWAGYAACVWALLFAGWGAAALLSLYGLANLVQHLLIATGVLAVPAGLGEAGLPWHLLLWDPVWIVGGGLFTLAALGYSASHTRTTGYTRR